MRLGLENPEPFELAADKGLALRGRGRQGRARVGPTGRPIITMPPLSEDGYWSRNRSQSQEILYCSSRASGQSPRMQASNNCEHRFGQIDPAAE